ncbi:ATP-binding protein [Nocardioides sp.]|uniref:AAA family ATPase n=1 Tax=Nocardioides sp. TaxID=35761 RepID=UPI00263344E3|nr:ATP-binding protein [Nocardioides sp.]
MYLRRIVCRNIRAFAELDINLCPLYSPSKSEMNSGLSLIQRIDSLLDDRNLTERPGTPFPGWTVITGDNGSGKSTILKAIALALMGPDKARFLQPSYDGWVTQGAPSGSISLEVRPDPDIDKTRSGGRPYKDTFWAEVDIEADTEQPGGAVWLLRAGDNFRKKKRGAETGPWQAATSGWLGIGYGPFRRLYGTSPTAAGVEADPLKARFATLFLEEATLREGERWLQELDYRRVRAASTHEQKLADVQLNAVTQLLSADFLRNGMEFDTVDASGVWLFDAERRRLRLSDMSEGYRAALAMLIDIIRHIFLCYDDALDYLVEDDEGEITLAAPAVVLIDEVDAHLHPAWQRDIGTWLTRHFPLVQFIVTTHSPLVCQAATGGRVFTLTTDETGRTAGAVSPIDYERLVKGDTDDVLSSPAFGLSQTRSIRVVKAMQRHAELQQMALFDLPDTKANEYEQLELFFEGRLSETE